MAGQSNPYTPITFSAVLPLKNGIFTVNMPPPPDTAWLNVRCETFATEKCKWLWDVFSVL